MRARGHRQWRPAPLRVWVTGRAVSFLIAEGSDTGPNGARQQERRSMHTPTPVIEYRAEIPDPLAFVRLFTTTGWDPQDRLTVEAAARALAPTWYAVSAYEGVRLVGTGRIIGDGVLHALLADVIVDPAYQHRGIGSAIVEGLVAECRRHRIVDVQLFCAPGVESFYERLGFAARPDDAPGMELVAGDA